MEIEERFWCKIDWDLRDTERCWPWLASKMHRGYGQFSLGNGVVRAHRLAYELYFGEPISKHLQIDHTCHDPQQCEVLGDECPHRACCNPFHMVLTTNRDNHQKGRTNSHRGGTASQLTRTPEERRAHAQMMQRSKKVL